METSFICDSIEYNLYAESMANGEIRGYSKKYAKPQNDIPSPYFKVSQVLSNKKKSKLTVTERPYIIK